MFPGCRENPSFLVRNSQSLINRPLFSRSLERSSSHILVGFLMGHINLPAIPLEAINALTLPSLYYLCRSLGFTSFSFPPSVCMENSHRACQPQVHHNLQHLGQLSALDPHSLLPPSTCTWASSKAHNVPRWNYFFPIGFFLVCFLTRLGALCRQGPCIFHLCISSFYLEPGKNSINDEPVN